MPRQPLPSHLDTLDECQQPETFRNPGKRLLHRPDPDIHANREGMSQRIHPPQKKTVQPP